MVFIIIFAECIGTPILNIRSERNSTDSRAIITSQGDNNNEELL